MRADQQPLRQIPVFLKMEGVFRLCVFCGSRSGDDEEYVAAARRLGEQMAREGVELVYGG